MEPGKRRRYLDYLSSTDAKMPRASSSRYRHQRDHARSQDGDTTLPFEPEIECSSSNMDSIYEVLNIDNVDEEPPVGEDEPGVVDELVEEITSLFIDRDQMYSNANEFLFDEEDAHDDLGFHEKINVDVNEESGEEYLFDGSRLKVEEFILLILTFASHCHITGTALRLLLKIIELVCPERNRCKSSMKEIYSFIKSLDVPLRCHYYCRGCYTYRGTIKTREPCPCCQEKEEDYYIDVPMLGELKKISERLWKHMDYRFKKDAEPDIIQDVYDGAVYRNHFKDSDGFLRDANNLSLIGFTDGVSIFKSSGFSVWPVYFCINELPPKLRFRRENGIFAGLWFGKAKPHFPTFFKPFVETMWELYENGMEIITEEGAKCVRVMFLQMTCDAPAKCLFQNFKQFNGKYGCPYCLHPGESCLHENDGKCTRSYIYNYRCGDDVVPSRNHKDTVLHAEEAHKNKLLGKTQIDVFGVKGFSWALYLPHFDIIQNVCLDYMHAILLGVTKQLMTLWFSSTYKKSDWSCFGKTKQIQQRLMHIKPTNNITRVPRSLEELHHWKASEFRAWLLFYGQECMHGILDEPYFQHFLLLVESVWLLLKDRISTEDTEIAENNLSYFCFQVQHLYGTRALTFNMHQVLHLTQSVKNHGPLWTHSCFYFEDYNGQLRHFFHGTQNVEMQVLRTVSILQSLPELAKKLEKGSKVHTIYSVLSGSRPVLRSIEKIEDNIFAVGIMTLLDLENEKELAASFRSVYPHFMGQVFRFFRLLLNGDMIHSESYQRVAQRNSYTVNYNQIEFGHIIAFYRFSDGCLCNTMQCYCKKETKFIAAINNLPLHELNYVTDNLTGLTMNQCTPVKKPSGSVVEFVDVTLINEKVLYGDFDSKSDYAIVIKFPNHFEKD